MRAALALSLVLGCVLVAQGEKPAAKEVLPQARAALTLESLQSMALDRNPSLREFDAAVQAARGKWQQAGLGPNPFAGYSGQQLGSRGLAEQQGVVFGQQFIMGGKLKLDRSAIGAEIERRSQELFAQRQRILTDVALSYFDVLAAQNRYRTTERLTEIGDKSVKSAQGLLEAKIASKIDVLQAKIEAQNARLLKANTSNRVQAAWRRLAATIGDPHLVPQEVAGSLSNVPTDLTWESSRDRLLGQSPELAAAFADAERARWLYQRALQQVVPDIDIQGLVQKDQSIRSTDGAVQITMPIPILNRNQGAIREAFANIAVAEQAAERISLQLEQRLAGVFERYSNAQQQVEQYEKELLPASVEQLDLVAKAIDAGETGYLNYLVAQRTYFTTNLAYIEALRDRAQAACEIQGLLLTGSLDSASSR